MELTAAGVAHAERILSDSVAAEEEMLAWAGGARGRVRVGAARGLVTLLAARGEIHPAVEVPGAPHMLTLEQSDLVSAVLGGFIPRQFPSV